jgi:hypothetical protein
MDTCNRAQPQALSELVLEHNQVIAGDEIELGVSNRRQDVVLDQIAIPLDRALLQAGRDMFFQTELKPRLHSGDASHKPHSDRAWLDDPFEPIGLLAH